ncbi:MAG: SDR family oxidoreductase [Phycisphaerae bacterium]|nr:SDR family oxidoreductase [Phycisphaerae bacterium]
MTARRPMALVTGGALRVGRAICLALARAGCDVTLTYRKSGVEAESLVHELRSLGASAESAALDLEDLDAVAAFGRWFSASSGGLDVLVHNASIYEPTAGGDACAAGALRAMRINAIGPLVLTRELSAMLSRSVRPGGGSIVCLCDIHASDRPRKGFVEYAMSKAALEQMVRVLAVELAPRVRVNGVAPGVVAFPASGPESDPALQARYVQRVPLGRSGTVEEAAEAVRWLALDATYTTGEVVRVDGGRRLS